VKLHHVLVIGMLAVGVAALEPAHLAAQANATLGTVHISRKVMADGKPLAPGTYQVRSTSDRPQPAAGQTPDAEQFVEFVQGGKVIAREVATVIAASDVATVMKSKGPAPGSSLVELLKGNEYVRVWINKGGTHYIINLPTGA
jgi:hypothetical protein